MKKTGLLKRKDFDNMNVNSRDEKVKQSNKPEQIRWPACWKGYILPHSPLSELLEDTAFLIPVTKLIG